jgi:hypothetical protein
MDLIKLSSETAVPTELTVGEPIFGYDSALWVERYQKPGEFKIEAKLSSGLLDFLPIDGFVTHVDTKELMMIENHHIKQPRNEDPTIEISGRSFTAYLEQRYLRDYYAATSNHDIPKYQLASDESWDHIFYIIDNHFITSSISDDNLVGVDLVNSCTGTGTSEAREIRHDDILTIVQMLLKIDDIGLKTIRPTPTDDTTYWEIYQGTSRINTVRFSKLGGDLDDIEYLFSNRKRKTRCHTMGRWCQTIYGDTEDGYARRTMLLDTSDIDQQLNAMPSGGALFLVTDAMQVRAREALANQNDVSIVQVDVANTAQWVYRRDYDMGDLVTVDGDFGASETMRVVEYAEVEDENGSSGHPTLAIPGED